MQYLLSLWNLVWFTLQEVLITLAFMILNQLELIRV